MNWIAQNWPTLVASLGSLGAGGLLTKWLDHLRSKRTASDAVAMTLVERLSQRVALLERAGADERAACATALDQQRELYETKLSLLRQEISGYRSETDVMMLEMALEMAPEKATEFLARMRDRRAARA